VVGDLVELSAGDKVPADGGGGMRHVGIASLVLFPNNSAEEVMEVAEQVVHF